MKKILIICTIICCSGCLHLGSSRSTKEIDKPLINPHNQLSVDVEFCFNSHDFINYSYMIMEEPIMGALGIFLVPVILTYENHPTWRYSFNKNWQVSTLWDFTYVNEGFDKINDDGKEIELKKNKLYYALDFNIPLLVYNFYPRYDPDWFISVELYSRFGFRGKIKYSDKGWHWFNLQERLAYDVVTEILTNKISFEYLTGLQVNDNLAWTFSFFDKITYIYDTYDLPQSLKHDARNIFGIKSSLEYIPHELGSYSFYGGFDFGSDILENNMDWNICAGVKVSYYF